MQGAPADDILRQLQEEGFSDVQVCGIDGGTAMGEHTHDDHTVHVILEGELIVTDSDGTTSYKVGDRMEFPAGTKHSAKTGAEQCRMVVGVKKE